MRHFLKEMWLGEGINLKKEWRWSTSSWGFALLYCCSSATWQESLKKSICFIALGTPYIGLEQCFTTAGTRYFNDLMIKFRKSPLYIFDRFEKTNILDWDQESILLNFFFFVNENVFPFFAVKLDHFFICYKHSTRNWKTKKNRVW